MSLKSERERAAIEAFDAAIQCYESLNGYEGCAIIARFLRAAEKRAMVRVMDWIDCEGGDRILDAGQPIPINQLLDEEAK